ncbi:MAG: Na+/H+ antiporter NhaC family protein [Candidatus Hinthialibacter antarcticus]|nr:Na+/H+ antiporter NhaC family protein [Candidatus Hinthialibacter antarcticus]
MEGTFVSLLPPLAAILLCIVLREAILSLFIGVFVGALILNGFNPFSALFHSVDGLILNSLIDEDHLMNIIFVVLIGGFVEIMNRSGYTRYWISTLANILRTRRNAGVSIWASGMLLFVDDYANSLIVGNGFRKLVDRVGISREKLAFLVDTTSAPITSIMFISTWIGFEISTIQSVLDAKAIEGYSGYGLFFTSIPYRFYPILILFFCFWLVWSQRDFGPMRRAEEEAIRNGGPGFDEEDDNTSGVESPNVYTLLVFAPFAVLTIFTLIFLTYSGVRNGAAIDWGTPWATMADIFNNADAYRSIVWATLLASVLAYGIHLLLLRESFAKVYDAWLDGCKSMFPICMILTLAWSIGSVCTELGTDAFVASILGADFNPAYLPVVTFICAAVISFSTGTSFGTMSILIPIVMPLALPFSESNPEILNATVGSILGGAIFGDHCSPISDTTILSSAASGCTVTSHVNTQLPYALTAAAVAAICLLSVNVAPAWTLNIGGGVALVIVAYTVGRKPQGIDES